MRTCRGSAAASACAHPRRALFTTTFEPDVRAADLRDPGRLVTGLIRRELLREPLPGQHSAAWNQPDQVILAKTANRSVLGCMNDMAILCEVAITRSGGLAGTNVADLNQALRRNIRARAYTPPIEFAALRPQRAESVRSRRSRPRIAGRAQSPAPG